MSDKSSIRNSTFTVVVMCAIVFLSFTVCYLYFYQADLLAFEQHVLSEGQTHYDRTVGTVVITLVLMLLQYWVFRITRLYKRGHALTYFPSLLVLTILTDVNSSGHVSARWIWLAPLLLLAYAALAWVSKQFETYEPGKDNPGLFSRVMWINLLTLFVMFMFTLTCSNSSEVFHNRLKMENRIIRRDYRGALQVGQRSLETDSSLTMLRTYALAKSGLLGERLFCYPLVGGSQILQPDGHTTRTLVMPSRNILLLAKSRMAMREYTLATRLLNRDIDAFARDFLKFYSLEDSTVAIPRHYREALVLYTHMRSNRVLTYHDEVLDADYADMRKLERQYPDKRQALSAVRDTYGNTYWFYFIKQ